MATILAASIAFYRFLGLDLPDPAPGGPVVIHRMGSGVSLLLTTSFAAIYDPAWTRPTGGYQQLLEFYVGDDAVVDRLVGRPGGRRASRTHRHHRGPVGPYAAMVDDPGDGNVILLRIGDAARVDAEQPRGACALMDPSRRRSDSPRGGDLGLLPGAPAEASGLGISPASDLTRRTLVPHRPTLPQATWARSGRRELAGLGDHVDQGAVAPHGDLDRAVDRGRDHQRLERRGRRDPVVADADQQVAPMQTRCCRGARRAPLRRRSPLGLPTDLGGNRGGKAARDARDAQPGPAHAAVTRSAWR